MARKRQAILSKRRTPRQARALETIETIFEATARIVEREGPDALNTNRIAERAGIAIGSLYGYFPNKQAILLAMARREIERTQIAIRVAIETADPNADIGRLALRGLIRGFGGRNKLRRAMLETIMTHGRSAELAQPVDNLTRLVLGRVRRAVAGCGRRDDRGSGLRVEPRAGWRHSSGGARKSPLLGTQTLEDELICLARGYVGALAQTA